MDFARTAFDAFQPIAAATVPRSGEIDLLQTILAQARDDLLKPCGTRGTGSVSDRYGHRVCLHCHARLWVHDAVVAPFSFAWICDVLNLDSHATRSALLFPKAKPYVPPRRERIYSRRRKTT